MTLVCAISGYPPEEPVISKDGYIFERRLIERLLSETGQCPITKSTMTVDDLRPVQVNASNKAMPLSTASLPALMKDFESEWSRVLVDSFNLKAQLDAVQEELARSLYEQESSTRVVAQLMRERDEALAEVSRLQEELAQLHYSSNQ